MEGSSDQHFSTGGERGWQDQFGDVDVGGVVFRFGDAAIDFKFQPVDVSLSFFAGKIKSRITIFQQLVTESRLVVFVGIGPEMKQDKF